MRLYLIHLFFPIEWHSAQHIGNAHEMVAEQDILISMKNCLHKGGNKKDKQKLF